MNPRSGPISHEELLASAVDERLKTRDPPKPFFLPPAEQKNVSFQPKKAGEGMTTQSAKELFSSGINDIRKGVNRILHAVAHSLEWKTKTPSNPRPSFDSTTQAEATSEPLQWPAVITSAEASERAHYFEIINNAELVPLTLESEDPECPTMQAVGKVYMSNDGDSAAFYHLADGNEPEFRRYTDKGMMLNRWHPTPLEQQYYPKDYVSPRDDLFRNMSETSNLTGEFLQLALITKDNLIIATLSVRVNPTNPGEFEQYKRETIARLRHVKARRGMAKSDMQKDYPFTTEIDTINTLRDSENPKRWRGAGTCILAKGLGHITVSRKPETQPKKVTHYRFNQIRRLAIARNGQVIPDEGEPIGHNDASTRFFNAIGSDDWGSRYNKEERVVREVPHMGMQACVIAQPTWLDGRATFEIMRKYNEERWEALLHKNT